MQAEEVWTSCDVRITSRHSGRLNELQIWELIWHGLTQNRYLVNSFYHTSCSIPILQCLKKWSYSTTTISITVKELPAKANFLNILILYQHQGMELCYLHDLSWLNKLIIFKKMFFMSHFGRKFSKVYSTLTWLLIRTIQNLAFSQGPKVMIMHTQWYILGLVGAYLRGHLIQISLCRWTKWCPKKLYNLSKVTSMKVKWFPLHHAATPIIAPCWVLPSKAVRI